MIESQIFKSFNTEHFERFYTMREMREDENHKRADVVVYAFNVAGEDVGFKRYALTNIGASQFGKYVPGIFQRAMRSYVQQKLESNEIDFGPNATMFQLRCLPPRTLTDEGIDFFVTGKTDGIAITNGVLLSFTNSGEASTYYVEEDAPDNKFWFGLTCALLDLREIFSEAKELGDVKNERPVNDPDDLIGKRLMIPGQRRGLRMDDYVKARQIVVLENDDEIPLAEITKRGPHGYARVPNAQTVAKRAYAQFMHTFKDHITFVGAVK